MAANCFFIMSSDDDGAGMLPDVPLKIIRMDGGAFVSFILSHLQLQLFTEMNLNARNKNEVK